MKYNLLEKTELWITPLSLSKADLNQCASVAATVLGLSPEQIMVTDAQAEHLVFDILSPVVDARNIVARKGKLLTELSKIPGIEMNENTDVHSDGILGLISLGEDEGQVMLARTREMSRQIENRIAQRAKVFPTGTEVISGHIKDTNTPYLIGELEAVGYTVASSIPLPDQAGRIAGSLRDAVEEGYGVLITTGGVGAESKDQSVEALLLLDKDAATPYVLKFKKGQGRHAKDGVRLGVGQSGNCILVTLPGPHDEVRLTWPVLKKGLEEKWSKQYLADRLADALRQKFLNRQGNYPHSTSHTHGEAP